MVFCPEHPKRDQNPKFTSLSETTSIPTPFICGVPPPRDKDLYGEKTYRFCNLRKGKDFNKKQLTSRKMCVTFLLYGQWADLWLFYGLYCKRFSLGNHTGKQKHTTLARLADFYLNPFTFVGYRNNCFLPIQILIL